MRFINLEPQEFQKFANKSSYKSFYQTIEIAKYREQNGWTIYYFGVEENGKILAASLVTAKPSFLGKSVFYLPGGPLLDLEDVKTTNFFFKNLKNYAKSHNGYVIHIEPYYELIERDINGEPVENGFNHKKALKNLQNLGFKRLNTSDEPKYLFVMDLNNRNEAQLLADFKRHTRYYIKRAEKQGVKIRELKKDELQIFKTITQSTSSRRNFTDKPLKYYEQMHDLFVPKNQAKFILAEAEINGKTTPLSVAMFITYGNEVIYLFSGSEEKYMHDYHAQYLIQWYMIKYAATHKFKKYNFYGMNTLPDPNSKEYGVYKFKKGFGGHVVELIGAHELPVSHTFYQLRSVLSKIKQRLK